MNNTYSCEIIKDLLPGYVDGVLSEAGANLVKEHLKGCGECAQVYQEMNMELNTGEVSQERIVLDGLKKIRRHNTRMKMAFGAVLGLLVLLLVTAFLKIYVIGAPLSTALVNAEEAVYDEEADSLVIKGTTRRTTLQISRVVWEESEEDSNAVHVLVYGTEALPWSGGKHEFTISIPDMKGKTAYLVCPEYDLREIYSWENGHSETVENLKDEIYDYFAELDRDRDILSYAGGIETVDGIDGIQYHVDTLVGEDVMLEQFDDQIITDGDLETRDFEIWISLEEPRQILVYDYQTKAYKENFNF